MSTKKRLLMILSTVVILLCLSFTPALADNGEPLTAVPDPIDPQGWLLHRDMTWGDLKKNPVIDWMTELNPAGLDNKFAYEGNPNRNRKIVGGLLMFEYLERKFITRGEVGSDPMGYYLYNTDGSGPQSTVTKNPVFDVYELVANEKYDGDKTKVTDADFAQWWADFLNKPQDINNGVTIDGFWRENSYGQWSVELKPYGPFTIPYFEFETMGYDINSRFQTYNDVPPSFRKGTDRTNYFRFDDIAHQMAVDEGVPFKDLDFFFLLHAGNAESGVWQEFGQLQFASRKDVPYELGPGPRMKQVEEFFTKNPDYLNLYVSRYADYPGKATFQSNLDAYNALNAAGKADEFTFKLSQEDWDWVAGYNDLTAKNTRYVDFTSWEAAVSEWSHAGSYTFEGRRIPRSTQGENNGMATFAHEFGHISSIADNYGDPWGDVMSPATEPWDVMSRGSFGGPFGDHARWTVPGIEASSVPVHMMHRNKEFLSYYSPNDVLTLSVQELADTTPVVAKVVARNIPLANEYYPWLADYGLVSPNYYKAIKLNFGSGAWADQAVLQTSGYTWTRKAAANMTVEVVDRSGYDSFNHDSGVILSRTHTSTGNPSHAIIDPHLYDIEMVDFYMDGKPNYYPIAHAAQLADAAFHAGVSSVDTGYYKGSEFKGDTRISDEVVSGDTVNEFHDPYNKLHFYILDKQMSPAKYGEFLSYEIGILHDEGVAVGGKLVIIAEQATPVLPGLVAVQNFKITNTGDATDIVRVRTGGCCEWPMVLQNNLYAIGAGETITVPVYVEIPFGLDVDNMPARNLAIFATSESNGTKSAGTAISTFDLIAGAKGNLRLVTDANLIKSGDYFHAYAYFRDAVDSNTATAEFIFDTDKFLYRNFTPAEGVEVLSTTVTDTGVKFTFMKRDYATKSFGELLLSAKEDIDMAKDTNELKVTVDYVVRENGNKVVKSETASTLFTTYPNDPPDDEYSLVALSNLIDVFGMRNTHPNWGTFKFYDFNKNNMIDIQDISKLASMLK